MSTSGPSTLKVSPAEFTQMKEQMSELMRMEQQLMGSDAKVEEGDVHMVAKDRGYNWQSHYLFEKPKEIHISWGI